MLCEYGHAHFYRINRVKQTLLILLHILVVRQRKTLHRSQKCHQMPVYTPRFPTNQFRHIRGSFLGHNAGACGICVGKLDEMEFMAAPEDDFLAEAAQMHHQDRKRGCQLNAEISVGNAVHAVHGDCGKAQFLRNGISVQRVGGGGKCATAKGITSVRL